MTVSHETLLTKTGVELDLAHELSLVNPDKKHPAMAETS